MSQEKRSGGGFEILIGGLEKRGGGEGHQISCMEVSYELGSGGSQTLRQIGRGDVVKQLKGEIGSASGGKKQGENRQKSVSQSSKSIRVKGAEEGG